MTDGVIVTIWLETFIRADLWVSRDHCGWVPGWLALWMMAAPLWITVSYLRIPFYLRAVERQAGRAIMSRDLSRIFGLFVMVCGVGHVVSDVLPFFWPHYVFIAAFSTGTAVISHLAADRTKGVALEILRAAEEKDELEKTLNGVRGIIDGMDASERELEEKIQRLRDLTRANDPGGGSLSS